MFNYRKKVTMKKNNITNSNYEYKGVFGDQEKFNDSGNRLQKTIQLISQINPPPKMILDIGGGTGYLSSLIKHILPKSSVYCLDISQRAIEIGKKKYKNVNFQVADAEGKLPFSNNFFDLIISAEHIACLRDTDTFLEEANRILRKNGTIIVTASNLASWLNRILIFIGKSPYFYEPTLKKPIPIVTIFGHTFPNMSLKPSNQLRVFTKDSLTKLLNVYNFQVIKTQGASYLNNKIAKPVDLVFSKIPSLSTGLIFLAIKK